MHTSHLHADHLDTPRQITDTQGNVVWRWDNTDPFGNNMPNDNPNGAGQFSFNLRFPGQYADRETNTYYNVNRDYDPAIGRYVESDPIGLAGGINTYGYVGGNPLRWIDPLGLYTEVTAWNPVGIGGSSFGHVSTNINGISYSWGPGGWNQQQLTASAYNARQTEFRGGSGVILNLSKKQEADLAACLRGSSGAYNAVTNNCGHPIQNCLKKVGVDVGNSMLPRDVLDNLRDSPSAVGNTFYPDPRSSSHSGFGSGLLWN